jgi:hypothetical protein
MHSRYKVDFRAFIYGPSGYHPARTLNLSKSGAELITSYFRVSQGDEITVLIKDPTKVASLLVKAQVVWHRSLEEDIKLGLAFRNLSSADLQLLEEIIEGVEGEPEE